MVSSGGATTPVVDPLAGDGFGLDETAAALAAGGWGCCVGPLWPTADPLPIRQLLREMSAVVRGGGGGGSGGDEDISLTGFGTLMSARTRSAGTDADPKTRRAPNHV